MGWCVWSRTLVHTSAHSQVILVLFLDLLQDGCLDRTWLSAVFWAYLDNVIVQSRPGLSLKFEVCLINLKLVKCLGVQIRSDRFWRASQFDVLVYWDLCLKAAFKLIQVPVYLWFGDVLRPALEAVLPRSFIRKDLLSFAYGRLELLDSGRPPWIPRCRLPNKELCLAKSSWALSFLMDALVCSGHLWLWKSDGVSVWERLHFID